MPSFKFEGFQSASPVAITVAQGASSESGSVAEWGGGGNATLSIDSVEDGALVAPTGVWFHARPTGFDVEEITLPPIDRTVTPPTDSTAQIYDPSFHEITYVWTVTRPGGSISTYSTSGLNLPLVWNTRNVAYGKKICFVFDEPGETTIGCWAVDKSGNTASATWQKTILDPDVEYAGANTICINPTGDNDFSDAPAGARIFTDWDAGWNAYANTPSVGRVLLKRGGTYDFGSVAKDPIIPAWVTWSGVAKRSYVHHDAYGTGAHPKVLCGTNRYYQPDRRANMTRSTIANIDWGSGWDETTETGFGAKAPMDIFACPTFHLFHRCRSSGFNNAFGIMENIQTHEEMGVGVVGPTIHSECTYTNWRDYGAFVGTVGNFATPAAHPDGKIALVGCSIARSPNALMGGGGDRWSSNNHGPLRIAYCQEVYIGGCDFFSRGGWAGGDQPCLRLLAGPFQQTGSGEGGLGQRFGFPYLNMERTVCEGGQTIAAVDKGNSGFGTPDVHPQNPVNAVVDKFLTIGNERTDTHISQDAGGTTIRNTLMIQPNVRASAPTQSVQKMIFHDSRDDSYSNLNRAQRVSLYNITGIMLRTGANNNDTDAQLYRPEHLARFDDVVEENNLFYAPVQTAPDISGGPFTESILAGFTPRYQGLRFNFEAFEVTLASVADSGTFTVPYPSGTDQSYFLSHPEQTFHFVRQGSSVHYAETGAIGVSFSTSNVTISNNSGATMDGNWLVRLDRTSQLPAIDPTGATPPNLFTLWEPNPGQSAVGTISHDDFLLRTRTGAKARGAVET